MGNCQMGKTLCALLFQLRYLRFLVNQSHAMRRSEPWAVSGKTGIMFLITPSGSALLQPTAIGMTRRSLTCSPFLSEDNKDCLTMVGLPTGVEVLAEPAIEVDNWLHGCE